MSMSAPSAINTDFSTVKFDDETTEWNDTGTSQVKSAMSHRFVSTPLEVALSSDYSNDHFEQLQYYSQFAWQSKSSSTKDHYENGLVARFVIIFRFPSPF